MTDSLLHPACQPVGAPVPLYDGSTAKAVKPSSRFGRMRCTAATRRRSDMMRALIGHFQLGEMRQSEIQDAISLSPSGARKYIRELIDFSIITVDRYEDGGPMSIGIAVFRLNRCENTVAKFIESLDAGGNAIPKRVKKSHGEDRQLHLMGEAVPAAVRMRMRPVAPDPIALPASFFRPPQADAEPLAWAMPVIPPKPAGFPVPSSYRFELEVTA
jgi:hypothetical protein